MLMQHGPPLPNAGDGNVLEYNLVIEDYQLKVGAADKSLFPCYL
jgi:hypothetical protein